MWHEAQNTNLRVSSLALNSCTLSLWVFFAVCFALSSRCEHQLHPISAGSRRQKCHPLFSSESPRISSPLPSSSVHLLSFQEQETRTQPVRSLPSLATYPLPPCPSALFRCRLWRGPKKSAISSSSSCSEVINIRQPDASDQSTYLSPPPLNLRDPPGTKA